jgi:hypothetical protein
VFRGVLPGDNPIVLNKQLANGHSHPTVLTAMIMYMAFVARFPTDSHNFIEVAFVDEITCVIGGPKEEIRLQTRRIQRMQF